MKDVVGFEGLYAITEDGQVWSYKRKIFLKPSKQKGGYLKVILYLDGKTYTKQVHRLVAETYIPNPENKPQVNHIDGNKENNSVNNLEWATVAENIRHAVDNNLKGNTHIIRRVHDRTTGFIYSNCTEAAKVIDGTQQNVWSVCRGRKKQYKGHIFEYVE